MQQSSAQAMDVLGALAACAFRRELHINILGAYLNKFASGLDFEVHVKAPFTLD